mmetsp:Transcript_20729/g.38906  ORF Transcript_20729/g.38906 Transcript_20729/m.38906 type:complete len:203 (+) Transcript_20729:70-678(+)
MSAAVTRIAALAPKSPSRNVIEALTPRARLDALTPRACLGAMTPQGSCTDKQDKQASFYVLENADSASLRRSGSHVNVYESLTPKTPSTFPAAAAARLMQVASEQMAADETKKNEMKMSECHKLPTLLGRRALFTRKDQPCLQQALEDTPQSTDDAEQSFNPAPRIRTVRFEDDSQQLARAAREAALRRMRRINNRQPSSSE